MENETKPFFKQAIVSENPLINQDSTLEEVQAVYDKWAESYDQESVTYQYVICEESAKLFTEIVNELSKSKSMRIIDIGSGTGLLGAALHAKGFTNMDAFDLSEEMLKCAAAKGVYSNVIAGRVGGGHTLAMVDSSYDALMCLGCLITAHIPADAMMEFVRVVKPGGLLHFSLRESVSEDGSKDSYLDAIRDLVAKGYIEISSQEQRNYTLSNETGDSHKQCILYTCVVHK